MGRIQKVNATTGEHTVETIDDAILAQYAAESQEREQAAADIETNEDTVRDRARQALASNADYLALASPTNAQVIAQVRRLTRQAQGLIRLELRALDDVADTDTTA